MIAQNEVDRRSARHLDALKGQLRREKEPPTRAKALIERAQQAAQKAKVAAKRTEVRIGSALLMLPLERKTAVDDQERRPIPPVRIDRALLEATLTRSRRARDESRQLRVGLAVRSER